MMMIIMLVIIIIIIIIIIIGNHTKKAFSRFTTKHSYRNITDNTESTAV